MFRSGAWNLVGNVSAHSKNRADDSSVSKIIHLANNPERNPSLSGRDRAIDATLGCCAASLNGGKLS